MTSRVFRPTKVPTKSGKAATRRENVMRELLESELALYDISVKCWKPRSYSGQAFCENSSVDMPVPFDAFALGVGLHEIGHVIMYRIHEGLANQPLYLQEYYAEQYAIRKLREWHLPYMLYQADAVRYVMRVLAAYKNAGGDMCSVPKDVVLWTGLNLRRWKKAARVVVRNQNVKRIKDINVSYS